MGGMHRGGQSRATVHRSCLIGRLLPPALLHSNPRPSAPSVSAAGGAPQAVLASMEDAKEGDSKQWAEMVLIASSSAAAAAGLSGGGEIAGEGGAGAEPLQSKGKAGKA